MMNWQEINQRTFPHARTLTYALSSIFFLLALALAWPAGRSSTFVFANYAGFLSFTFLSLALAVTPLKPLMTGNPFYATLVRARRAFGVSAFAFSLIHVLLQFGGIFQFDVARMLAQDLRNGGMLSLGGLAFLILFILALTSTDYAVRKLGRKWFDLHKLVYLAYPFIIIHVVRIGVDFKDVNLFSGAFFVIATATLALEAHRIYSWLTRKPTVPSSPPA